MIMENWKDKLNEIKETELVNWLTPAKVWFQQLPSAGKLAVGMGGLIVSLSLLNTFFRLVASLFTLGFFVLGIALFYKFFIEPKTRE